MVASNKNKSRESDREDKSALEENACTLRQLLRPLAKKIKLKAPTALIARPWPETKGWWVEIAKWGEYHIGLSLDYSTNSVRIKPSSSRFYWFGFWSEARNSAQKIQNLVHFMPAELTPELIFKERDASPFKQLSQLQKPVVELNSGESYFGRYDCRLNRLRAKFDADLAVSFIAEVIDSWRLKQYLSSDDAEVFDIQNSTRSPREKEQLIAARRGQGIFRKRVAHYWQECCALTGCNVDQVLRASHILPWKESNDDQKLDGDNGILLSASYDALFDKGLISFTDDGAMLVSGALTEQQRQTLGLPINLPRLKAGHRTYLDLHRKKFGFPSP